MSRAVRLYAAALPHEVSGLARGWPAEICGGLPAWRRGETVVACLGMGYARAYNGAKVLIEALQPEVITSIGFVGAACRELPRASVLRPSKVLHLATGSLYDAGGTDGLLVTVDRLADSAMKAELFASRGAVAVEMEAAGVACAAQEAGAAFRAIRAVSDGADDELDFTLPFMRDDGFATGSFLAHVACRPWLWGPLGRLASTTRRAAQALRAAVEQDMAGQGEQG